MTATLAQPQRIPAPTARVTARALTLGFKAAVLLAIAVMLIHAIVLWWARGELQSQGFNNKGAKILYSRLIVPQVPQVTQAPSVPETTVAVPPPVKKLAPPTPKPAPLSKAVVVPPKEEPAPEPAQAAPTQEARVEESKPEPIAETSTTTIATEKANRVMPSDADESVIPRSMEPIAWPLSTRIQYQLSGYWRGDLHGSGEFEWRREADNAYQLYLRVRSLVGIEYRSRGKIGKATLMPERYEEQLPRGVTAVSFNHESHKVSFSRITDVIEMAPEMQDRVSAIMQLVYLLMADPGRFTSSMETNQRLKIAVANPSGADNWEFDVKGIEDVNTASPSGVIKAWHLQRVPRKPNGDLGVDLWLSQALQGMPVRIKLTLAADTFLDLNMSRAEQQ